DVTDDSNAGVDGGHALAGTRPTDPLQEAGAVDQRSIGIAGHEAGRQILVEPAGVRSLGGPDVAEVQLLECRHVAGARLVDRGIAHRLFLRCGDRTPPSCLRIWPVERARFELIYLPRCFSSIS